MHRNPLLALLACFTLTSFVLPLSADEPREPVRLIYDTDIGNDVDDVQALAVIHALQSRGQCELLAVTVTKDEKLSAPFVDVVNTFYGRGNIPIGVVKNGPTPGKSRFTVLADKKENGQYVYPHDLLSGDDAPEATGLLRKVLVAQPDHSVVIAQVGFSSNLARLLASPGDDVCPLSGKELVAKKVKLLSTMAGTFGPVPNKPRHLEYNIIKDIPAAAALAKDWPTPIIYSGYEIGIAICYPAESILRDYAYVKHHPVPEAYILYMPPPHNRPTWDLTSVLYGIFPDRGYFDLSPAGRVTVSDDGFTAFAEEENGPHRFLKVNAEQIARVREALVQLSSEPPHEKP